MKKTTTKKQCLGLIQLREMGAELACEQRNIPRRNSQGYRAEPWSIPTSGEQSLGFQALYGRGREQEALSGL